MPAAAVTPAPIAYIKVAAVKKLVVGSRLHCRLPVLGRLVCGLRCTVVVLLRRPVCLFACSLARLVADRLIARPL